MNNRNDFHHLDAADNRKDLPRPSGICGQCQAAAPALKHVSGRLALYCDHNKCGAVYQETDGDPVWTLFTPMSREEFIENMRLFAERYRDRALVETARND